MNRPSRVERHEPKTAALIAYVEGALSEVGRERLERHLAACAVCQRQLAAMRLFEELRGEALEQLDEREPAWERIELPVRREAARVARQLRFQRRVVRWGAPAALAAVALLGVLVMRSAGPAGEAPSGDTTVASRRDAPPPASPEAAESPPAHDEADATEAPPPATLAVVTAVSGKAEVVGPDGLRRPLLAGTELLEGETLATAADGRLHVRLGEGTGFVLGPEGRLRLLAARPGTVVLGLQRGTVHSRVAPLGEGERYEVVGGERWVARVRGTRFSVGRPEGGFAVAVSEGAVEVLQDGESRVLLRPGQSWGAEAPTTSLRPESFEPPWLACAQPGCTEPGDLAVLELPPIEHLVGWEIDGVRFGRRLQVRVPRGTLTIYALGHGHRRVPLQLQVEGDRAGLPPDRLTQLTSRLDAAPRGTIDEAALGRAVRAVQPALQRCHRRALKERPDLAEASPLRLRARLTIGRSGVVRRLRWRDRTDGVPSSLRRCLEQALRAHPFPQPQGGPVEVELPLRLDAR